MIQSLLTLLLDQISASEEMQIVRVSKNSYPSGKKTRLSLISDTYTLIQRPDVGIVNMT